MRSSSISSFAILASSLLVREVFALPVNVSVRDIYLEIDNVLVTEEVYVTEEADGSYETGVPSAIGTSTIQGSASLIPQTTSSEIAPAAATTSSSISIPIYTPPAAAVSSSVPISSSSASISAQAIASTSSTPTPVAAPTTSLTPTTPIAVPTSTSTTPATVAPTTLATVAAPTSSAPAISTSAASSSSSKKRGLAYNDASLLSGFASGSSKVSWAYNWAATESGLTDFEYVPMLWGLNSWNTNGWESAATSAIAAGSTALLAFNEPDLPAQANLGYADAAAGYLTYMSEPFAGKAKLVSPAVTNGGSPMGLAWLGNFIDACSTCTIDAIALHWYNGGTADDFISYIEKAYAAGGNRPIWVTEFQASGSDAEQAAFLETVMAWMDSSDMVERYAYFMASDGILLSSGSSLSSLGETFASS